MNKSLLFIGILGLIVTGCQPEPQSNTTEAEPSALESTESFEALKAITLSMDPCTFYTTHVRSIIGASDRDFIGNCNLQEQGWSMKSNYMLGGEGSAFYMNVQDSNLADLEAIKLYYEKYQAIPNIVIEGVDDLGHGAVWLNDQHMLVTTYGDKNITVICSSRSTEADYDKKQAMAFASKFIELH